MDTRFHVIVAGSRTFENKKRAFKELDRIFAVQKPTAIICGEARGADTLGKLYAESHGIPILSFPADWKKYGRGAGYIRNAEMLKHADCLIAFWDGESKGTRHMIDISRKAGIIVHVVRV